MTTTDKLDMKTPLLIPLAIATSLLTQGCATTSNEVSPATKIARMTVLINREIGLWIYCDASNSKGSIARYGKATYGRQSEIIFTRPSPRPGEYACSYVHSHPWEGTQYDEYIVPGPSQNDLQVSMKHPSISFGVVDKIGVWWYKNGKINKKCPWSNNYRRAQYCTRL